ncbi:hypothetical protein [Pluralibacter sp.]|uniref:hypothetical protein n=1 Tax=Pluralibacter sp. TaxID=1920032 RepID=UPI0025CE5A8A|nr:hypothetical protein [Pluralibacter sp.]MBV8044957.1 hypothetical protein [Pluralibacter sp.]
MNKIILSLVTAALLMPALSAHATYQGEQRQDARNVRQETRTQGREEKRDCVASNNKSNAQCRHDKRQNRQTGRQNARDVKW